MNLFQEKSKETLEAAGSTEACGSIKIHESPRTIVRPIAIARRPFRTQSTQNPWQRPWRTCRE